MYIYAQCLPDITGRLVSGFVGSPLPGASPSAGRDDDAHHTDIASIFSRNKFVFILHRYEAKNCVPE